MPDRDFEYDVFLSHAGEDTAWCETLTERLRNEGVRVWFDKWELQLGDNVLAKINDGLAKSRKMIAVWSANYFRDGKVWTLVESFSQLHGDPLSQERPIIPLLIEDCTILPTFRNILYIDFRNKLDFDLRFRQLLQALDLPKREFTYEILTMHEKEPLLNSLDSRILSQDELAKIIEKVLAEIIEQWQNTPNDFISMNIRKRLYFSLIKKRNRNWATPKICLYPDCDKKSISYSHSIQESGALKLIADDGHLLTPHYNTSEGTLILKRLGIHEASTFPGFCTSHESVFKSFEINGRLNSEDDFKLQTFRTICQELRSIEQEIFLAKTALKSQTEMFEQEIIRRMKEKLGKNFWQSNTLDKSSLAVIVNNSLTTRFKQRVISLEDDYKIFFDRFYKPFDDKYSLETGVNALVYFRLELPIFVPVCLADRVTIIIESPKSSKRLQTILNIQPHPSGTSLWMTVTKSDELDFRIYYDILRKNCLLALSMIENWMTSGSVHWFIKPGIWNQIPESRQVAIRSKLLDSTNKIPNDKEFSIFDELRVFLIEKLKPKRGIIEIDQIIKREQAKLEYDGVY